MNLNLHSIYRFDDPPGDPFKPGPGTADEPEDIPEIDVDDPLINPSESGDNPLDDSTNIPLGL